MAPGTRKLRVFAARRASGAGKYTVSWLYRGSEASGRGLRVDLSEKWHVRFSICQHYRRSEGPDRAMPVKLRKI